MSSAIESERGRLDQRAGDARTGASLSGRYALVGLAAVLSAGLALRVLFMFAWRPAFVGFSDSGAYLNLATTSVWGSGEHPPGYPLFLADLHAIGVSLWLTVVLQHLFGLLIAALLWLTVRLGGGSRWLALAPAAVIALSGDEMFLEHSILSETLFTLLLCASMYSAARLVRGGNPRWAISASLLLAIAYPVRVVALPLIPVLLIWMLCAGGRSPRARARAVIYGLIPALVVLGGYAVAQHNATGYWGIGPRSGAWELYSRVAPFADCTRFTPPPGTRVLCEETPPALRTQTVADYEYSPPLSPALKAYGRGGGPDSASQASDTKLASFTRAVVEHQPLDYAQAVLEGMIAYITPRRIEFSNRDELGPGYGLFFHELLFDPASMALTLKDDLPSFGVHAYHQDKSVLSGLLDYETYTRVTGLPMALLMLLSLFAPFAPRGPARKIGVLLFLFAWCELIIPPATHWWDARYATTAIGPLAASAAIGSMQFGRLGSRVWNAVRARRGAYAITRSLSES